PPSDANHLALFIPEPDNLTGTAATLNANSNGLLSRALSAQKFDGKPGSYAVIYGLQDIATVMVFGATTSSLTNVELHNLGGKIAKAVGTDLDGDKVVVHADTLKSDLTEISAHLAFGYQLQNYRFDKYQTKRTNNTGEVVFVSTNAQQSQDAYTNDLQYLAGGIYLTRDLASEPGKNIYPQAFVDRVNAQFKGVRDIDIDVLTLRDMKKRNMGALMGVGQGSIHDPRMLVIEYKGADKNEAPIVLAGKGITFDTGGISLKRNSGMWAMKSDLAGAAAVAGTVYAAAKRGEKVNLIGVMPLAENMPAEDAIRPGDVLNTMQGTTIEVISTDAEGRLVLADAVYYAQQEFKPKLLLNIATLTGSAARALSHEYAAVITRDWDLSLQMMKIGDKIGEAVWPLPLHENHFEQIKSDIADIKNSGAGNPGASIGAAVIGTFIDEKQPWVHLDIAGVDWYNSDTDTVPVGSSGWGVRFMDQLVRDMK
ncbi:leucyl aminopeptidase family protein, partial [Aliiglaciecola sp.]|nr:leucyl aminopeptidase family protein [Aliiglaciecola sp.]